MMKKLMAVLCVMTLLAGSAALAETVNVKRLTDKELKKLYQDILTEAERRRLTLTQAVTLPEGRYIVGKDIKEGTYTITCISTEAENVSSSFGALGSAMDSLSGDSGTSYSSIYSSLGSAFTSMDDGVTVEIIGDYGTVIKKVQLKKGESATLKLEGKVALKISDGSCKLEGR